MRRREFITLLGGAPAVWPLAARAQQPTMPVIGYLNSVSRYSPFLAAFWRSLNEAGYVEGRNVAIEYRFAEGHVDQLPALAADLVRRQVTVIVATNTQTALVAKAATQTIPIVFQVGADPVEIGLVSSLNRPGGNLTGVSVLNSAIAAKRLQLLHEVAPAATSIAFLANPANPVLADSETREVQPAARALGVHLLVLNARDQGEIEAAFPAIVRQRAGALQVSADPLFINKSDQLVALAAKYAVPTMFQYRESTAAGGLMSYGASLTDQYRQFGAFTGRILKGSKPADLPVEQISKFEFVINLKTAKTLGLTVPLSLLTRADEVIE
jgi:putative tryptophan/tyrosine transport system substrate-binding protein